MLMLMQGIIWIGMCCVQKTEQSLGVLQQEGFEFFRSRSMLMETRSFILKPYKICKLRPFLRYRLIRILYPIQKLGLDCILNMMLLWLTISLSSWLPLPWRGASTASPCDWIILSHQMETALQFTSGLFFEKIETALRCTSELFLTNFATARLFMSGFLNLFACLFFFFF